MVTILAQPVPGLQDSHQQKLSRTIDALHQEIEFYREQAQHYHEIKMRSAELERCCHIVIDLNRKRLRRLEVQIRHE